MKLTRSFLQSLQQRLSIESRRGVHLNAVPGRSRLKLDASALVSFNPFGAFPVKVEMGPHEVFQELDKKLSLLHFEVEDILSEKGIHTFGFGYPLLLWRDNKDKLIVAPILIWSLQLSRNGGQWVIDKNEEDGVVINEILLRQLQRESGVLLDGLYDWMEEGRLQTPTQLEAMIRYLSEKLTASDIAKAQGKNKTGSLLNVLFEEGLEAIPGRASLQQLKAGALKIHWGGLFAVFEVRYQNLLYEYDTLLQLEDIELNFEDWPAEPQRQLTAVKTDPAQQAILDTLSAKRTMLIHGPPGTGKSQTLTAIILNALTKGQRILVVCGKQTALQVILDQMEQMDLDRLAALVKEVKKDRRAVVNKVRQVVDARAFFEGEGTLFARNDFEQTVKRGRALYAQRQQRQGFYSQKIWGDYRYGDLVALLLEIPVELRSSTFPKTVQKQLHDESVNHWTDKKRILQEAEQYYFAALPYLDTYNPAAFAKTGLSELETILDHQIAFFEARLEETENQQSEFESTAHKYLSEKYERIYQQVLQQIDLVKNYLSKPVLKSAHQRNDLSREQHHGLQYYHQLCTFLEEEEGLGYEPVFSEAPEDVLYALQDIKASMQGWKRSWPELMITQIKEAGQAGGAEELEELPAYERLQNNLSECLDTFNEQNYFVVKTMLQSSTEETIALFRQRISDLHNLRESGLVELCEWAGYYDKQNKEDQLLMNALSSQQQWAERYSAFVLTQLLKKHTPPEWDNEVETQWKQLPANLEKHQIPFIQKLWRERQRVAAIRFQQQQRMEVAQLYNKRSTAALRKFSLREMVAKDLHLFQSFFPVVLTTPETASLLFRDYRQEKIFDLVLFDESSQLKVEEGIPALLKGQQVVIAGDEHQMPPAVFFAETSENESTRNDETWAIPSWLDFATTLPNIGHAYLDFHYRSRHPALIDFSNTAFYKGRLCPMPPQVADVPISFRPIMGRYIEGLNEEEAEDVVTLLQKLERSADGFYPTVGIATFNVKQRNLILEKINRLEHQSAAFAAKMMELRDQGLFVKNLENIQGDERDLMIISTVYGKGEDGKFSARFGPVNQEGAYKLLNVLITRAKYKIIVCCSVPEKVFQRYPKHLQADGNNRKAIFYVWLAYAKAVSEEDHLAVENILMDLQKQEQGQNLSPSTSSEHLVRKSLFADLVYKRLLLKLDTGHLQQQVKLGGYAIDLLYTSAHGKRCILIFDGWNEEAIYSGFEEHPGIAIRQLWSEDWRRDEEGQLISLVDWLKND